MYLDSFLNSALDDVADVTSRPLYPREITSVLTGYEASWALGSVWAVLEAKKSFALARIRTQSPSP